MLWMSGGQYFQAMFAEAKVAGHRNAAWRRLVQRVLELAQKSRGLVLRGSDRVGNIGAHSSPDLTHLSALLAFWAPSFAS